jgi:hypothetical protein
MVSANVWRRSCVRGIPHVCPGLVLSTDARHPSGDGFGVLMSQTTFSPKTAISPAQMNQLLQDAWMDVRYSLHPLIAIVSQAPEDPRNVDGYSMTYPLVDAEGASTWAKETVKQHGPSASLQDFSSSLEHISPTARNSRSAIHFAPSSKENDHSFFVVILTSATGSPMELGASSFSTGSSPPSTTRLPSRTTGAWKSPN